MVAFKFETSNSACAANYILNFYLSHLDCFKKKSLSIKADDHSLVVGKTQDLTTPRANTLFDDADDIQRQLDNEARDRMKYGKVSFVNIYMFFLFN